MKEVQEVRRSRLRFHRPAVTIGSGVFPMEYFRHIYSHEVAAVLASHIIRPRTLM